MNKRRGLWSRLSDAIWGRPEGTREASPDFKTAYDTGLELFQTGRYEESMRAFLQAIELQPNNTCSWEMFGCSLGNLGRFDESLEAFDKAKELGHECENCWFNRSIAHWSLCRREETLKALERVIEIAPNHSQAWYNRAMILGGFMVSAGDRDQIASEPFDGRHDQSLICFDRFLKLDPNHVAAWYYRGCLLRKLCQQAQIRNSLMQHLTGEPSETTNDLVREAASCFDRAHSLRPDLPHASEAKTSLYKELFGSDPNE
jgi:tetratricopeptide (TPR) repeat protein